MPAVNGVALSLLTPRSTLRPSAVAPEPLPPLQSTRLLDRLRERIRGLHYSMRTEEVYLHWCKAFIRFHDRRHPAEMGAPEVEAFLQHLAAHRGVSPSTHNQALSALLFLYGKVLQVQLPWLTEIGRPPVRRRLPVVLTRDEVRSVLERMSGEHQLLARLLYGTGLRISEALQLRVKDLDFGMCAPAPGMGENREGAGKGRKCREGLTGQGLTDRDMG